jgi:hypothetical protein
VIGAASQPGSSEIGSSRAISYQRPPAKVLAATDPDGAEHVASSIFDHDWRATALTEVAKVLAVTDPDQAERLAYAVDEVWRPQALAVIELYGFLRGYVQERDVPAADVVRELIRQLRADPDRAQPHWPGTSTHARIVRSYVRLASPGQARSAPISVKAATRRSGVAVCGTARPGRGWRGKWCRPRR